jgi:hypothetical protein
MAGQDDQPAPRPAARARDAADRRRAHAKRIEERLGHSSITTTLNLYGHVLRCTEAAQVDALDAIYEQCYEGVDAAAAQDVERARGLK